MQLTSLCSNLPQWSWVRTFLEGERRDSNPHCQINRPECCHYTTLTIEELEAAGFEPAGVGFKDPASDLPPPLFRSNSTVTNLYKAIHLIGEYRVKIKNGKANEFQRFTDFMKRLVSVPHAEIKEKLDAEKRNKKRATSSVHASHANG